MNGERSTTDTVTGRIAVSTTSGATFQDGNVAPLATFSGLPVTVPATRSGAIHTIHNNPHAIHTATIPYTPTTCGVRFCIHADFGPTTFLGRKSHCLRLLYLYLNPHCGLKIRHPVKIT